MTIQINTLSRHTHLKQDSAVRVHVGVRILHFAGLLQNIWHNLIQIGHEFKQGVLGQVLQGKLPLASVTWVSLPQDGMAKARDNLWGVGWESNMFIT